MKFPLDSAYSFCTKAKLLKHQTSATVSKREGGRVKARGGSRLCKSDEGNNLPPPLVGREKGLGEVAVSKHMLTFRCFGYNW